MPVSRYVRRLIDKRRLVAPESIAAVSPATITAFNRMVNNLNQLPRHANGKGDLAPVARHLEGVLAKLETAIDALLDWPY